MAVLVAMPALAFGQATGGGARPTVKPAQTFVPALPSASIPVLMNPTPAVAALREPPAESIPPGAVAPAANMPTLSLADLEGMALANNPVLARAAARVEAARGQWVQVGLPPNPTAGYSAAEIGDSGRAGQQGGSVGQEVVTGGKLRLNRAVATQEIRVAQQEMYAERYRVLNDVRIGYYAVLIAQRRIEITAELQAIGQRSVGVVEQFVKGQEASRVDLLQARVESNTAKILHENARNDYLGAWRRLAAVLGMPQIAPVPLVGDLQAGLTDLPFEGAMQQLLVQSPELAAARANVNRAAQAVARARAEPYPNVDLQGSVQHDNSTSNDIAGVQIGIPLPILNRNQGGIRRAQAEWAAAQSEVQRLELELHQRLATVYQRYANARQQVETYTREILPDAQSSLELVTNGYRQGEIGYLLLLTSQRTFFQTNLAYLESLGQLRESTVEIDGLLLTGSLDGGTRWR